MSSQRVINWKVEHFQSLDSVRFRNLLDDLDYDLLDFHLPIFHVLSTRRLSKSFGIDIRDCHDPNNQPTIEQTFEISVTTDKLFLNIYNSFTSSDGDWGLYLPAETEPIRVYNLTSFIFGIVHDKTPLFLGIRKR